MAEIINLPRQRVDRPISCGACHVGSQETIEHGSGLAYSKQSGVLSGQMKDQGQILHHAFGRGNTPSTRECHAGPQNRESNPQNDSQAQLGLDWGAVAPRLDLELPRHLPAAGSKVNAGRKTYQESEGRRIAEFDELRRNGDAVSLAAYLLRALPKDMKLCTSAKGFSLETRHFSQLLNIIPGARLEPETRTMLDSITRVSLDGSQLSIQGRVELPLGGTKLGFQNFSCKIIPEKEASKKITLCDIKGLLLGGQDAGIKSLSIAVSDGKIQFSLPGNSFEREEPQGKPALKNRLVSACTAKIKGVVNKSIPPMPLAPNAEKIVSGAVCIIGDVARRADKNPLELFEAVAGRRINGDFARIAGNVSEVRKSGEHSFSVTFSHPEVISLSSTMALNLDKGVSCTISGANKSPQLTGVSGVHLDASLGVGQKSLGPIQLQGFAFSSPDGNGNRALTVSEDHIVSHVSLKVGPDLRLIPASSGNLVHDADIDLTRVEDIPRLASAGIDKYVIDRVQQTEANKSGPARTFNFLADVGERIDGWVNRMFRL